MIKMSKPLSTTMFVLALGLGLGSVLLFVHGWLSLVYAFMVVAFIALKTAREERWLRDELAGYVEYERRVRRLIPFVY